jgi:hypothetical protein
MLLLGPPPPPPAVVLFEESIGSEKRGICSAECLSFIAVYVGLTTQVRITGDAAVTTQLNPNTGIAELRAVHTSLNKKARQERMSTFEREYPW